MAKVWKNYGSLKIDTKLNLNPVYKYIKFYGV